MILGIWTKFLQNYQNAPNTKKQVELSPEMALPIE